ncbi:MAG: SDR family NAD(P)-dependent oxidoreductase [Legionella sp.]
MSIFKSKLVLITCASSGIGLSFAQLLAKQGSNLILVARHQEQLEQVASELSKQHHIKTHVIAADLAEPGAAQKIFSETQKLNLSVDILINNAGFGKWGDFLNFDTATYSSIVHLNIIALTDLCHLYLPQMLEKKEGGIINVASTAAFLPIPYSVVYAASKAYVLNFSEALYVEVQQSRNHGLGTMSWRN